MGLRLFRIYVAPYLMRKGVEKMNQKMKDHMEGQFSGAGGNNQQQEGEVTVEYRGKKDKRSALADDSEYVEFEEIE